MADFRVRQIESFTSWKILHEVHKSCWPPLKVDAVVSLRERRETCRRGESHIGNDWTQGIGCTSLKCADMRFSSHSQCLMLAWQGDQLISSNSNGIPSIPLGGRNSEQLIWVNRRKRERLIYIYTYVLYICSLPWSTFFQLFYLFLRFSSSTFRSSQLFYLFLLVSFFSVPSYALCGLDFCNTLMFAFKEC